ncbi:MAG: DUF6089 family protein [Marinoscillum sp.]
MKKQVILCVWLLSIAMVSTAQNFLSWQLNDRYFSGELGFGFASYRGELKHYNSVQNEISNLSLRVEARLLSKLSARLELGRYSIRGHDKHAPDSSFARQRNLSFNSTNYEISLQGIFFLRKYKGDYYKRWKLDPYLLLGVGTTFMSPTAELSGETYNLFELETESANYARFTLILPAGAGLKWKINNNLNFITELTYRYTFSDHLDDVSGDFPDEYPNTTAELLGNRKDEIGIINEEAYARLTSGNTRGDQSDKDAYLFLNFKFEVFIKPDIFKGKKKPTGH